MSNEKWIWPEIDRQFEKHVFLNGEIELFDLSSKDLPQK